MALKDTLHQKKLQYQGTKFAPVFNALHTFLYTPDQTTTSGSHIRDAADLKRTMAAVCMALIPTMLFGIYNIGYQHYTGLHPNDPTDFMQNVLYGLCKFLPILAVSYGVGLGVEFLFAALKGHEVEEGYLVSGLLIPLIVPVDIPLWMLAIAVIFGVIIGKEVFGGTGMNIFNPALVVRAFLFFAYPGFMSGDKVWVGDALKVDAISGETILGSLASEKGLSPSEHIQSIYDGFGNTMDMFNGWIPGSIGETSTFAILLGAIYLIYTGVASWRVMFSGLLGAALTALMFNQIGGTALMEFPWYNHLVVGGLAFGLVFMATDPVTGAQTLKGKWIYGFMIGMISILVRVINPAFPEGVMMAILLMNVFAPLIDYFVVKQNINQRTKRAQLETPTTEKANDIL